MSVDHYENFPVASWLCPPTLRPPVAAIYWFARTADDLADEGDLSTAQRLADLAQYRADLRSAIDTGHHSGRWPTVFDVLPGQVAKFKLPQVLLEDLLSAFEQDVTLTAQGFQYPNRAALLDYCRLSANPVGRLMLHLHGVADALSLTQSDNICTALQLINFWQDLSRDIPRGRYYLPSDTCRAYGLDLRSLATGAQTQMQTPNATKLIASEVLFARTTMLNGSDLAKKVAGRAGWELRLVVQGGLRILDKIEALNFATLVTRPKLHAWDAPVLLFKALSM